jgi:hypothetical protein
MNNQSTTTIAKQAQAWTPTFFLPQPKTGYQTSLALSRRIAGFDPISLEEMENLALLNRIDTKYILPLNQLFPILSDLRQDYRVLDIKGQRVSHYRTLYFDTPFFDLFHMHVNGRAERYKVRCREYVDTRLSFLEVKHRTRKDRTIKERLSTRQPLLMMTPNAEIWLSKVYPFDSGALCPTLWNTFSRITLASKQSFERVTIDTDLVFYAQGEVVELNNIAIAEVKMDSHSSASSFVNRMREHRIQPNGFSKYVIGVSLLYDQVKTNTIKPKLLHLEKIAGGVYHE